MLKHTRYLIMALIGAGVLSSMSVMAASPTGAKALFDSGEGTTIGMSVGHQAPATKPASKPTQTAHKATAPAREKYVGISYQMMVLGDDGRMTAVSKNRVFKTGERVKIIARANRPGYLAVLNRGSSGLTHVLYHDYVDAFSMTEIPKNTNLRFVGTPGKEDIVLMLSDQPNPIALQAGKPAQGTPSAPPAGSYTVSAPTDYGQPAGSYNPGQGSASSSYGREYSAAPAPQPYTPNSVSGGYTPPPPAPGYPPPSASYDQSSGATMMAQLDGAKSLHGAKDLVIEDSMESAYAVVSPKQGYRPVQGGMKDLVLETSGGTHYGVVPAAAVSDGGMLTLKLTLTHK